MGEGMNGCGGVGVWTGRRRGGSPRLDGGVSTDRARRATGRVDASVPGRDHGDGVRCCSLVCFVYVYTISSHPIVLIKPFNKCLFNNSGVKI